MRKLKPGADMPEKSPSNMMFFERMEPKILLSADALAGLVSADPFGTEGTASSTLDIADSADFLKSTYDSTAEQSVEESSQKLDILAGLFSDNPAENEPSASPDVLVSLLEETVDNEKPQEIIFVDTGTPDYQELIDGITDSNSTHYQVFLLQSDHDGIEQISQVLAEQHGINAVHLISHGDATGLQLGDTWLSTQNLDYYAEQIQQWQTVLSEDADLLIYGCDLASELSGQALINTLAELSGADVAASDDLTGAVSLGGDWQLEYQTGEIESDIAVNMNSQQLWNNTLGTINVTTTNDVLDADADLTSLANLFLTPGLDGQVSLREAIIASNNDTVSGLDEITLTAGTYTISINGANENLAATGDLDINDELVLKGASSATTIIDGTLVNDRAFAARSTGIVFSDMTITNGGVAGQNGGAVRVLTGDDLTLTDVVLSNNSADNGGAIFNNGGNVTLDRVVFDSNTANADGGAIYNNSGTVTGTDVDFSSNIASGTGGAVYNADTFSLDRALLFNNTAAVGGAIDNEGGTVNLTNVTVSANTATVDAGAINNTVNVALNPGTLNITNATFTNNDSLPGLTVNGIRQDSDSIVNIQNTILNDGQGNIWGGIINSLDYNIDSDGTALDKFFTPGIDSANDQVGTVVSPIDPLLDVLADNGGFSKTHALLAGSVAINPVGLAGAPGVDQRNLSRDTAPDIGAYESQNTAPTLDNAIANQAASEDTAFSFTFAANTFSDPDALDTLTYTATLSGGGVLPAWLSFDGVTRTFSGTPLNGDVGTISIDVTADDSNGGAVATDTFDIVIANSDDAPTLDNAIANQAASEDTAFSFTFAANTFSDPDALDTLTYTATLSGGGALPAWLSFDGATRTFSGTPLNGDVGTISIDVTADDSNGGAVATDTFDIVIANSDDAPTLDNAIANQAASEDMAFSFTFAANTFSDPDALDTLTYTATLSGGGALPAWLGFDGATRTFSGTPLNADVGTITIEVTADDSNGGAVATDTFDIVIANSDDAPTLDNAIANQVATEDSAFSFTFAANTFSDVDATDTLSYTATLSGGGALPVWLGFDGATRTFSGTPLNADVGTITIEVTADDSNGGAVATDTFDIVIANTNDAPIFINNTLVVSEGETVTVTSAMLSASDVDNATAGLVFDVSNISGGRFAFSSDAAVAITSFNQAQLIANQVFFVHDGNEAAPVFDISVSDGIASSAVTSGGISFSNVNDAPVAYDNNANVNEGQTVSIDLVGNDVDIENALDLNSIAIISNPANGSLTVNGDGSVDYTHNGTETVNDSFTYTILDAAGDVSNAATVWLTINPDNDAPVASNLDSTTNYIEGDVSVAITDIIISDSDVADIVNATLTLADVSTGELSANDGASYDGVTGIWTITDTVVNVNTALANLVFSPNTNTDVNTSISVNIDDGNEDGGGALTGTISLNVTAINDAPVVTNINSSVSFNYGDSSVPLNDIIITDVDSGEILTATLTLSNINAGSLSANDGASYDAATGVWTITGSIANVNLALANISFIPADSNPQDAVVSVSIDDGSTLSSGPILGSLNITVNPYTELLGALSSDPAADNSAEAQSDNSVTSEETEEKAIEETTEAQVDVDSIDINRTSSIDVSPVLNERQNEIHFDQPNVIDTVALPDKDKVTVKSESIESTVIRLREQMIAFNDPLNLIGTESFLLKLNDLREELIMENENTEKVIGGSLTVSAGFSVGYVVWLARSGALMSSLLTSLPAWRFVDPLPILASLQYKELADDKESLESIVGEQK